MKMKHLTYKILATLLLMVAFSFGKANAKQVVVPQMYMFGFAASFNDTIVYFTNVMPVDSVWIESRNKFLLGRSVYSHQLRNYLAINKKMPSRTCIILYNKDKAKLEKKLLKMKRLYMYPKKGKQQFDVRFLEDAEFRFKAVDMSEVEKVEPSGK